MKQPLYDKPGQPVIGHYEHNPKPPNVVVFESLMKALGYSFVDVKPRKPVTKRGRLKKRR